VPFSTVDPFDVRAVPNYTLQEASRYLRVSSSTLKSRVIGRQYPTQRGNRHFVRLVPPAQDKPTALVSVVNLVEIHVLHAIRHEHRIKLWKVRRALTFVERQLGNRHPLATVNFETDGIDLFISHLGGLVVASDGGQFALREAIVDHLKRIEHDDEGLAARLYPFTRLQHVAQPKMIVIDPRISFGRPVIAGSGVPTRVVLERYLAGEEQQHLARDYRRSITEIEEAIRCESHGV